MKGVHIIPSSETYNGKISAYKVQASNGGIRFEDVLIVTTTSGLDNGRLTTVGFRWTTP